VIVNPNEDTLIASFWIWLARNQIWIILVPVCIGLAVLIYVCWKKNSGKKKQKSSAEEPLKSSPSKKPMKNQKKPTTESDEDQESYGEEAESPGKSDK
jgi:predicted negative regulator of RcsB-dependent stress response